MYGTCSPSLSSIISEKCAASCTGFRILIVFAKICFFPYSLKPCKNIFALMDKFLKKPKYPEMRET